MPKGILYSVGHRHLQSLFDMENLNIKNVNVLFVFKSMTSLIILTHLILFPTVNNAYYAGSQIVHLGHFENNRRF